MAQIQVYKNEENSEMDSSRIIRELNELKDLLSPQLDLAIEAQINLCINYFHIIDILEFY